jgi:hypothetical protein
MEGYKVILWLLLGAGGLGATYLYARHLGDSGYEDRDIYLHMLDMILTDPAEHQKYRDIFDASYYRCAMLRAQKYSKQTQLEESFCALVKTGYATLNDKISYYNAIRSPYAFLLKLLRKINSLTGR